MKEMGVIRVTRRPYYYAQLEEEKKKLPPEEPEGYQTGTLSFQFSVGGMIDLPSYQQKTLKDIISKVFKEKGRFVRERECVAGGYYEWEKASVSGNMISVGRFDALQMEPVLELMRLLTEQGLYPDDNIRVYYYPAKYDISLLTNLITILESRRPLIEEALTLEEPFLLNIFHGLGLSVKLRSFSYTQVEAAAFLVEQTCKMAAATGKSRMKPCDMTNPKFQMRSWLLRLGFIGEQFERPRRTLLEGLSGDAAFFREDQKNQAVARRKAKNMIGGRCDESA